MPSVSNRGANSDISTAADGRRAALDVSVVIPTYNRERYLTKCLDYLFDQDYPPDRYEVVVVDDGSTDGTEAMVNAKKPACGLKYLRQPRTTGNGAAKNRGVLAAEGSVIVFIDSDAFAPPWYVREYAKSHRAHPHSIVDGPAVTLRDESMIDNPPLFAPKVKAMAAVDFFGQAFVNANASCLREDFIKAGGFDEDFKKWQDLEMCQRLLKLGLKRFRNRKAYVLHFEAGRSNILEIGSHMESRGWYAAMFYKKHPSSWARRRTRLRYMDYDKVFERIRWIRERLTPEGIVLCRDQGSPWYGLLKPLYVIHSYAKGLKAGFDLKSTEAGGG
jgi:glycosyltransferase involved in cell wall biosynthesis